MLYGIGCDLCEVARMEKSLSGAHGPAFVRRVFGPAEQAVFTVILGEFVIFFGPTESSAPTAGFSIHRVP